MPFITLINGEPRNVRQPTEEAAWEWLNGWHYSGPDAVKTVERVPGDQWGAREREQLQRIAPRMFRHEHPAQIYPKSDRALTRENCQACCLEGYNSETETFRKTADGPNVSNWQRDYVQSGRTIPAIWRAAFWSFRQSDNAAWVACLELDLATFGVRFEGDPPF